VYSVKYITGPRSYGKFGSSTFLAKFRVTYDVVYSVEISASGKNSKVVPFHLVSLSIISDLLYELIRMKVDKWASWCKCREACESDTVKKWVVVSGKNVQTQMWRSVEHPVLLIYSLCYRNIVIWRKSGEIWVGCTGVGYVASCCSIRGTVTWYSATSGKEVRPVCSAHSRMRAQNGQIVDEIPFLEIST
jgi:hypothetical protein